MILILIISFIILCLTITILHILIFKDRTSTRFWILSDYYWLSFSILGLIGVSKEAFNPFEEQFKKQIKFVIKQQYEQSIEDITKFINI